MNVYLLKTYNLQLTTDFYAFFFAAFFVTFAGLDFPNDPLKIFPFLVFLSPLPMVCCFKFF